MNKLPFTCSKCGNSEYETGEIRTTGGILSKIFDIQTRRFSTVTCLRCRYTEIFQAESSKLGHIFDFFTQ